MKHFTIFFILQYSARFLKRDLYQDFRIGLNLFFGKKTFYYLNEYFIKRLQKLPQHDNLLLATSEILNREAAKQRVLKDWESVGQNDPNNFENIDWSLVKYIKHPYYYDQITTDYVKFINHCGYLTVFVTMVLQEWFKAMNSNVQIISNDALNLSFEYISILSSLKTNHFEVFIDYNNFALQLAQYKLEQWNSPGNSIVVKNVLFVLDELKNQRITWMTVCGASLDKIFLVKNISDITLNYLFCSI